MPQRPFAPPTIAPISGLTLPQRLDVLFEYVTHRLVPYFFSYFLTSTALDSIRDNAPLTPIADGALTTFQCAAGKIRLAPDGTPQAALWDGTLVQWVIGTPGAGQWTLNILPDGTQQVVVGTAPQVTDNFVFLFVVLA